MLVTIKPQRSIKPRWDTVQNGIVHHHQTMANKSLQFLTNSLQSPDSKALTAKFQVKNQNAECHIKSIKYVHNNNNNNTNRIFHLQSP